VFIITIIRRHCDLYYRSVVCTSVYVRLSHLWTLLKPLDSVPWKIDKTNLHYKICKLWSKHVATHTTQSMLLSARWFWYYFAVVNCRATVARVWRKSGGALRFIRERNQTSWKLIRMRLNCCRYACLILPLKFIPVVKSHSFIVI